MREACEKGYNLVTLTDCVATTSAAGYKAAVEITYPFFSTPMNAASFLANVREAKAFEPPLCTIVPEPPAKRAKFLPHTKASWAFNSIADDVYQAGPWFVDVRQGVQGDVVKTRSGDHELRRYLTFAEASGMMGCGICAMNEAIYTKKRPAKGESTEPFGWYTNMTVIRLPAPERGCLLYSPVLDADQKTDAVMAALKENDLLPVRIVLTPTPQHHLCLQHYQKAFPDAFYICGKASGQMPPLTRKRRDLRFDGVLGAPIGGSSDGNDVVLSAPVLDKEGSVLEMNPHREAAWKLINSAFQVCIIDDNRSGEILLLHRSSKTLLISDLLYKSSPDVCGPGGKKNHYSGPEWFAEGQEELFYGHPQDNSGGLLPSYRTHPRMRSIDIPGMRKSLEKILAWDIDRVLACHVDELDGAEAKELFKTAWSFVWE